MSMSFESASEVNSGEDVSRFFSDDPYEVLGISRNATREEMKEARNNLQKKFYSDISEHPRALEITQKINAAYDKVKGGRKTFIPEPERARQKSPEEMVEQEIIDSLRFYDVGRFKRVIADAEKAGLSGADIEERILQGKLVQVEILKTFLSKVDIYWDMPGVVETFVNDWKVVGIDMWRYLGSEVLRDALKNKLIDYKIGIFNDPKTFVKIINAWEKIGVNLHGVINESSASKKLEEALISRRDIYGIAFARQWLGGWMEIGWKPRQEILDTLK